MKLGNGNVQIIREVNGIKAGEYFFEDIEIDKNGILNLSLDDEEISLSPENWFIESRYSPFDEDHEVRIKLGDSKMSVVVESWESNPEGTSYVRFVVNDHEVSYWNYEEWEENGQEVVGAIFGGIFSVIGKQEHLSILPVRLDNPPLLS